MRITQRAVALTSLQGLNRNLDAVGRLQQQLTSGRLISHAVGLAHRHEPGDADPCGPVRGRPAGAQHHRRQELARADRLDPAADARHGPSGAGPDRPGIEHAARRTPSARRPSPPRSASLRDGLLEPRQPHHQGAPALRRCHPRVAGLRRQTAPTSGCPARRSPAGCPTPRPSGWTSPGPQAFGPAGADLFAIADKIATDVVANPTALSTAPDRPRRRDEGHADRASPTSAPGPRGSTARSRSTRTGR